jgi:hypothetical protein
MKSNFFKCLLLTTLAFTMGCSKESSDISDLIIGKWEWVRTIRPYIRQEYNPQTTGSSQTIEFTPHKIMKEYINDLLVNSSEYTIVLNPDNPNDNLLTENTILTSHFYMVKDSLIFSEAYVDGPVITYVRKK